MNVNNIEARGLFTCDPLLLMEHLPARAVALAYLDPPWNTGSEFLFAESGKDINAFNKYIPYLAKIVQQINRVLRDDGCLFIHLHPMAQWDARLIFNQSFGVIPKHEIVWKKQAHSSRNLSMSTADYELFLVYCKSPSFEFNKISLPLPSEVKATFCHADERGAYRECSLTRQENFPTQQFEWRGFRPHTGQSWRYKFKQLEELAANDRISFSALGTMPRLKQYIDEAPRLELGTIWDDIPISKVHRNNTMLGQIPFMVMERIIQFASDPGDQILDPMCRGEVSVVAAQTLGRCWWGASDNTSVIDSAVDALLRTCNKVAHKDYELYSKDDVTLHPPVDHDYIEIVIDCHEIQELQNNVSLLTSHLLSLRKLINIGGDDIERLEDVIKLMGDWINDAKLFQVETVDSYITAVCAWVAKWDKLDELSQCFLPQAELLFENITRTKGRDYSPFVLQYCRALENELLTKLFSAYTNNIHFRHQDIDAFLADALADDKIKKFAMSLQKRKDYTLGDMNFIMNLLTEDGKTLAGSLLLRDFRDYTLQYFNKRIIDKAYLNQIDLINKDFRCKSAHPYVLDIEVALRCREQVRTCINELILNYKGDEPA